MFWKNVGALLTDLKRGIRRRGEHSISRLAIRTL